MTNQTIHLALLQRTYDAFNARDIEAVLETMTPDVDWPNAWEGGRVSGRAAVRDYWTRQFAAIHPHVDPTDFTELEDGRIQVSVRQKVMDLAGRLLDETTVVHIYTFRHGLIDRMDIEVY